MDYLQKSLTCYAENDLILARAFLLVQVLTISVWICVYVWEDLSDSEVLPTPFVWLDKSSCVSLLISIEHMFVSVNRFFEHVFVFCLVNFVVYYSGNKKLPLCIYSLHVGSFIFVAMKLGIYSSSCVIIFINSSGSIAWILDFS